MIELLDEYNTVIYELPMELEKEFRSKKETEGWVFITRTTFKNGRIRLSFRN